MRNWMPIVAVILFVLAVIVASSVVNAVSGGPNALVAMPTETVVQGFLHALSVHRWDVARDSLADDLNTRLNNEDLAALLARLEAHGGPIVQVSADPGVRHGDTATTTAHITTLQGAHFSLDFTLTVEDGVWRISALPLK